MLRTLCDCHGGNGPSDADADLKPEAWDECLKKDDEMFWYFVIRFLAATGARVSELIQIKAEHVKLGHLDLYSKGGKFRRIYIPKELQKEALSWLTEKWYAPRQEDNKK